MLRDVQAGKVGYWVSLEYGMCLFNCINKGQGSEGSSVQVEMVLMFFKNLNMLEELKFSEITCVFSFFVQFSVSEYLISNVCVPALEGV